MCTLEIIGLKNTCEAQSWVQGSIFLLKRTDIVIELLCK